MPIGGSSQLLNVRMVVKLLSNFVLFLLCKYDMTNMVTLVTIFFCCCNTIVLSTVLQTAGLGFTVGTLAVFLNNQVYEVHLLYRGGCRRVAIPRQSHTHTKFCTYIIHA